MACVPAIARACGLSSAEVVAATCRIPHARQICAHLAVALDARQLVDVEAYREVARGARDDDGSHVIVCIELHELPQQLSAHLQGAWPSGRPTSERQLQFKVRSCPDCSEAVCKCVTCAFDLATYRLIQRVLLVWPVQSQRDCVHFTRLHHELVGSCHLGEAVGLELS